MAQAMKGVTKALTKLNKKISLPGLQKVQYSTVRILIIMLSFQFLSVHNLIWSKLYSIYYYYFAR